MSYNRSSPESSSPWVVAGVFALLVGLVAGAIMWNGGNQIVSVLLLLGGVLGGPLLIGLKE